ncbi:MAG: squalene synthase HpnC [Janthinobacterium lividum]
MSAAALPADTLASGKGHRDENFPVASWLLKPEHRAPIMAFYRFARKADDIADHESAAPAEKLRQLAAMRDGLDNAGTDAEALALRDTMAAARIDPVHASDLLGAFVQDVSVRRYADWDDLIAYCRLSAMPVGRYVLDVHRENRSETWPGNDALCAALQIINHLQDCGNDYRDLDRVYIPVDTMAARGARVEELGADTASPALLAAIRDTAARTRGLLATSRGFAARIEDRRLAAEVRVIQRLAEDLTRRLLVRDPLSQPVHHTKWQAGRLALAALVGR